MAFTPADAHVKQEGLGELSISKDRAANVVRLVAAATVVVDGRIPRREGRQRGLVH